MKKAPKYKKYADGGPVKYEDLTDEQKAEYDGLPDDAAKLDFLSLLGKGTGQAPAAAAGSTVPLQAIGDIAAAGVTAIDKSSDGKTSPGGRIGSSVLKAAGTGAALGSVIPGIGTGIGAAAGAVVGGISSIFGEKSRKKAINQNRIDMATANARANSMNANVDIQGGDPEEGLAEGGKIHIKPENRGKFNATKKATGKSTEELTHSSNPVTKKRAIFAQNAAKWNHKAEGGEVDGPGTAKSDSVKTSLKPGSFVVPAENAGIAKKLHAQFFGTPTKLKEGGKVPVALSDGEFVFSPRQASYLRQKGIDLNTLAPHAKAGNKMKDGGEVDALEKALVDMEAEQVAREKELATRKQQAAKTETERRIQFEMKRKVNEANVRYAELKKKAASLITQAKKDEHYFATHPESKTSTMDQLRKVIKDMKLASADVKLKSDPGNYQDHALGASYSPTLASARMKAGVKSPEQQQQTAAKAIQPAVKPSAPVQAPTSAAPTVQPRKAPAIKRAVKEADQVPGSPAAIAAATAARNLSPASDQDSTDTSSSALTGDVMRDVNAAYKAAQPKDISDTTDIPLKEGNKLPAVTTPAGATEKTTKVDTGETGFTRGMAILGGAQAGIGLAQLLTSGKRPVDTVDPTLLMQRDQAIDDATIKMDPAVQAAAKNTIELNRRGTVNSALNAVGGDVGTGIAATIGANTEANRATIALAAEKERLGMMKDQRADQLTGAVAGMRRNIFLDKLEGFKENQRAMADLTMSGINNYIESRRLANANKNLALVNAMDNGDINENDIIALSRTRKTT